MSLGLFGGGGKGDFWCQEGDRGASAGPGQGLARLCQWALARHRAGCRQGRAALQCLKRQHLRAAGLDPAPQAVACLAPAPQPQPCPAASTHPWVLPPHRGDTPHSGPAGTPQPACPKGECGEPPAPHQPPGSKPAAGIGQGAAPAPGSGREQSHWDWLGRCLLQRAPSGLVSAWILT